MKSRKLINQNYGSAMLSVMSSVMLGVTAILSFYNVGQYLTAKSAVEQAARAAARCITPTDPECVSLVNSTPGETNITKEWYGFLPEVQDDKATLLDFYKYTASIDKREHTATYNSYEWNMQHILAKWNDVYLPTASFRGTLNRYARLYGKIRLPTTEIQKELRPLFAPPYVLFPPRAVTDNAHNHSSIPEVFALQTKYGNHVPWGIVETDPVLSNQIIVSDAGAQYYIIPPSSDKLIVYSKEIRIPTIPDLPCYTYNGEPCYVDINRSAVLNDRENVDAKGLVDTAHVAFIPTAVIKNKGSSKTTLRWSENFNNNDGQLKNGLWLHTYKPDGSLENTYCLGARTTHGFSARQTIPFNMDVRGPRGANDGIPGDCEIPKGLGDFSSIKVPRGGSFRIQAMLRRADDKIGANELFAQVRFLYWWDQYKVVDVPSKAGPEIECDVTFSGTENRPICSWINYEKCKNHNSNLKVDDSSCYNGNWKNKWTATRWEPHCSKVSHAFYLDDSRRPYHYVDGPQGLPICDDKWQPEYHGQLNAFSKVCSWKKTSGEEMLVGGVEGECPLARKNENSNYCGKHLFGSVTEGNVQNICPNITARINSQTLNSNFNKIQEKYGTHNLSTDYKILKDVPIEIDSDTALNSNWEFRYTDIYYDGSKITREDQIRPYLAENPKTLNVVNYKKQDGFPDVSKEDFYIKIIHQNSNYGRWIYGWDDMISKIQLAVNNQTILIDDVWPFNQDAAPRPYNKTLESQFSFDYNNDCLLDKKCEDDPWQLIDLEEGIRKLAAQTVKLTEIDLTDRDYSLDWSEDFLETRSVDPDSGNYPACSQYKTIGCQHDDSKRLALGISDEEPEGCKNGTYVNCYSIPRYHLESLPEYELGVDKTPAKDVALYEMRRLIPFVKECANINQADGCATVDIDASSDLEVKVRTKVNMPISFPMNAIWGKSMVVESDLRAVREIGRLG